MRKRPDAGRRARVVTDPPMGVEETALAGSCPLSMAEEAEGERGAVPGRCPYEG